MIPSGAKRRRIFLAAKRVKAERSAVEGAKLKEEVSFDQSL